VSLFPRITGTSAGLSALTREYDLAGTLTFNGILAEVEASIGAQWCRRGGNMSPTQEPKGKSGAIRGSNFGYDVTQQRPGQVQRRDGDA